MAKQELVVPWRFESLANEKKPRDKQDNQRVGACVCSVEARCHKSCAAFPKLGTRPCPTRFSACRPWCDCDAPLIAVAPLLGCSPMLL